jgi:hypothetical protein
VPHPVPWPQQKDASSLHEEHAKVAIAAFGDAPENRSITCGDLLRYQAEPSSKIAATCEGGSIADRSDDGARDDRTDARYCHQVPTEIRVPGERIDFSTDSFDAIVEAPPGLDTILVRATFSRSTISPRASRPTRCSMFLPGSIPRVTIAVQLCAAWRASMSWLPYKHARWLLGGSAAGPSHSATSRDVRFHAAIEGIADIVQKGSKN